MINAKITVKKNTMSNIQKDDVDDNTVIKIELVVHTENCKLRPRKRKFALIDRV